MEGATMARAIPVIESGRKVRDMAEAERQEEMFGCGTYVLDREYENFVSKGMNILGMLSDAQELLASAAVAAKNPEYEGQFEGLTDMTRQQINRVKYLLSEKALPRDEKGRLV
jgi:hypothetical protein